MTSKPVLLHFQFDAFEALPSQLDQVFESELNTDTNGNHWKLQLYPGGCSDSVEEGMVAVILINAGDEDITAKFTITARNGIGQAVQRESDRAFHLFPSRGKKGFGYGYSDTRFMKRDRILDKESGILVDGNSLHLDVAIEIKPNKDELYYPVAPLVPNLLRLLENGDDSNVSFCIEGNIIKAHLPVLRANAPFLADLFRDKNRFEESNAQHGRLVARRHSLGSGGNASNSTQVSVSIKDTSFEVFQLFLQYVYAGVIPNEHAMLRLGTDLIELSHRFYVYDLKMLVENALIEGCVISNRNVVSYLLFAEAKDCALLKEYAMSYFVLHVEDVLSSKYTKKLQEVPDLMKEVLFTVAKCDKKMTSQSPVRMMSVSEMRKELARQGLSVYGSRDVLISRLEGSS